LCKASAEEIAVAGIDLEPASPVRVLWRALPAWIAAALLLINGSACARVRPHISLPNLELGDPSFYPTLQAYAGAPIVGGNTVTILLNGEQIFPAVLEAIRAARTSIVYAQYYYEDGAAARAVADALAERCQAGLRVHVLFDGVGTFFMPAELRELISGAGCEVQSYRPVRPWTLHKANYRNHRRLLVVDGKVGFTGGSGVSQKWAGDGRLKDHWRDTDIRVEGPAVEWLQAAFVESWLEVSGVALGGPAYFPRPNPPRGSVPVQVVRSSPLAGETGMYTTLLLALASARRSIRITNPYFVLDDAMRDVLLDRIRAGVTIDVIVPEAIDHQVVRQASRATWGDLLRGGVRIYEYKPALLHAKTIVIDGVWATVGSTNLDNRSFALNDELNVVTYDRGVAERLDATFRDDLAYSEQVTYERWKRRGVKARLFEWLVSPFRDQL
jgi:cardiolipin synthase A/B